EPDEEKIALALADLRADKIRTDALATPDDVDRTSARHELSASEAAFLAIAAEAEALAIPVSEGPLPVDGSRDRPTEARSTTADLDPLRLFFHDISAYPLLSQQDEIVLARAIEFGRRANDELAGGASSVEVEARLQEAAERGVRARRRFIGSNL